MTIQSTTEKVCVYVFVTLCHTFEPLQTKPSIFCDRNILVSWLGGRIGEGDEGCNRETVEIIEWNVLYQHHLRGANMTPRVG